SGGEIIRVAPEAAPLLGLAVDLGTTKIAGYLVDLISGRTLAAAGTMNPQISFGDDIVSRMGWSMKSDEGRGRLKQIVVDALSDLSRDLCERAGASIDDVVDMVIVGNTAEHHLMLGLAVHALARAPYVPVVQQALDMKAAEVGVRIASGANVHVLPNISGYVGADHVAALLSTSLAESKGVAMLLDIGTNTEISLAVDGKVESVSCASGPVFEGGHIECGMRAGSGAIERVHIRGGKVRVQTIDGAPATGICGSGILDAIAQLLRAGLIDQNGRMAATASSGVGVPPRFLLWEGEPGSGRAPVYVSQRDVREVQLGKAAIRSGIQVLLESRKAHEEEIEKILIAGAFGSYLDVDSAIDIGLLPAVPRDRVSQIGNAAGMGAKLALISRGLRDKAKRIASEVGYVELGAAPSFFSIFVEASCLGKFRLVNGKRIEIN
ncbi:MAG: DUF4445 domain-containing protein, partial [Chloroflexi bacterium]|nr:DUF4445 domain-containing protein [Chloroflexota bacterium]